MARMKKGEPGHEESLKKFRATLEKRYGGPEGVREMYRRIGRKGGTNGNTGGFAANPGLAKKAGEKGGRMSKRTRNNATKIKENRSQILDMYWHNIPMTQIADQLDIPYHSLRYWIKNRMGY